jgi:hypothetical protein
MARPTRRGLAAALLLLCCCAAAPLALAQSTVSFARDANGGAFFLVNQGNGAQPFFPRCVCAAARATRRWRRALACRVLRAARACHAHAARCCDRAAAWSPPASRAWARR